MINENTIKTLNIKGENTLRNYSDSKIIQEVDNSIPTDNINNFLINSNLSNIDMIK